MVCDGFATAFSCGRASASFNCSTKWALYSLRLWGEQLIWKCGCKAKRGPGEKGAVGGMGRNGWSERELKKEMRVEKSVEVSGKILMGWEERLLWPG